MSSPFRNFVFLLTYSNNLKDLQEKLEILNFELQDNTDQIKVYTNFENGGFTYGLEEDIVNYIALAEDPIGIHMFILMI